MQEISSSLQLHLISWQHLAADFEREGVKLFKLRPKHHSCDHIAGQVSRTRLNPRKVFACFVDESFLGYLKKLALNAMCPQ